MDKPSIYHNCIGQIELGNILNNIVEGDGAEGDTNSDFYSRWLEWIHFISLIKMEMAWDFLYIFKVSYEIKAFLLPSFISKKTKKIFLFLIEMKI